jgi:hypothetical protein
MMIRKKLQIKCEWHFYPLCPKHQGLKGVPKVLGDKRFDKREGGLGNGRGWKTD